VTDSEKLKRIMGYIEARLSYAQEDFQKYPNYQYAMGQVNLLEAMQNLFKKELGLGEERSDG